MKYCIKSSPQHGKGVFASRPIRKGDLIMTFSGPILHHTQVDHDDYHLQIDEEYYIGASGNADDYVNHACEPNCGFRDGLDLVALRDIAVDEEITWDYSTAIDEDDFDGFPCSCARAGCRKRVVSFRHLSPEVKERLQPWLLPYLRSKYYPGES